MSAAAPALPAVYSFEIEDIHGIFHSMSEYAGRVLLIVNTASKCGFTSQLRGLEILHEKYESRGLSVMGFPCNQFGNQEPGTPAEIEQFCATNYGVQFPLFAKVDVNGPSAHPLFRYLADVKRGAFGTSAIKWNFTKFVIDRQGEAVGRFSSRTGPASLEILIEQLLAAR